MKKVLTVLVFLISSPMLLVGQETNKIYATNSKIIFHDGTTSNEANSDFELNDVDALIIYDSKTSFDADAADKKYFVKFDESCANDEQTAGKLKYKSNCINNFIEIWHETTPDNKITIFYCENKKFGTKKCTDEVGSTKTEYEDITTIPYPFFRNIEDVLIKDKNNRYLVIDANPNIKYNFGNVIWKRKKGVDIDSSKTIKELFEKSKSLPINSSLGVFLRGYNLNDIEDVTVTIQGIDYSYNKDISDIWAASSKNDDDNNPDEGDPKTDTAESVGSEEIKEKNDKRNNYLSQIYEYLEGVKYLSIRDIPVLESFKASLKETINNKVNTIDLDATGMAELSKILSWYPEWVLLTPIAIIVPESDQIEVETSIKTKNVTTPKTQLVGRYRASGGLAFNLGGMVYLTGLKNNSVFTETVTIDGNDELRARINSSDQKSLGIGMNGEVVFRTGCLVNPTINAGFFIPFEEELTPILAIGPGINISGSKVKLSFSGGLAYGKVNTIAERYRDMDLTSITDLTNESLTEQIWDSSWFIGFGLSFNLNGD